MRLSGDQREQIIDYLVANSEAWSAEGDADVLASFSDEKLIHLNEAASRAHQAEAVANAAVEGFQEGGKAYRVNPETGRWERAVLNCDDNMGGSGGGSYEDDTDEDDEDVSPRRTHNSRRKPLTVDEWYRMAPPEVQDNYRTATEIVNREKERVVQEILVNSNVPEGDRAVHRERLLRRDLEDLRNDLSLIPKLADNTGKPKGGLRQRRSDPDMLGLPTMNWSEVDKDGNPTSRTVSNQMVSGMDFVDDMPEDEALSLLPAALRNKVLNAQAIEGRERQKLIEQIVANVQDEENEAILRRRLANKSLDELKDYMLLAPARSSAPRANYFGASGPVSNARSVLPDNSNDDILPVPRIDWSAPRNGK
jgi:hypothetical protein